MKILITSDNHLGYNETDNIRCNDSFRTFEEILMAGRDETVDFIIQGGDLFHYNKPSRNTYKKTFELLKKYNKNINKTENQLRFSNLKVELNKTNISNLRPFLSIHGNHDDPSGYNSVSPMDVLHSTGLLYYFGKTNRIDQINIKPILIEKESAKVAVYGLGHIKDRRLYRIIMQNRIHFEPVSNDYYKILVVHQNRVCRKEEYFPEEKIPSFFNLVIFGHEHLSEKIRGKYFDIIQVGSSVRTSLSMDERGSKYVYFLDVEENKCKISRKELKSVRYFHINTFSVSNTDIDKNLKKIVSDAVNECYKKRTNDLLPLLRLRLETTEHLKYDKKSLFSMVENKIANPVDFIKIRKIEVNSGNETIKPVFEKSSGFTDIYKSILKTMSINTFSDSKAVDALDLYIEKNDKKAFNDLIYKNMDDLLKNINIEDLGAESIDEIIQTAKLKAHKKNEGL
ncbi:hypothetical protein NUSPORA_00359 [Nucleospora cyclopteri]